MYKGQGRLDIQSLILVSPELLHVGYFILLYYPINRCLNDINRCVNDTLERFYRVKNIVAFHSFVESYILNIQTSPTLSEIIQAWLSSIFTMFSPPALKIKDPYYLKILR